jgi:hypothetical protein
MSQPVANSTASITPPERWKQLVSAAMLGIDRAAPTIGGAAPWLPLKNPQPSDPTAAFLEELSSLAIYHAAGRMGEPYGGARLPSAPQEARFCRPLAGRQLATILANDRRKLLLEWLGAAAQSGWVAPPECVPQLLALAQQTKDAALRAAILVGVGARGRWLAQQNPAWTALFGGDDDSAPEQDFAHGSLAERLAALRRLRRTDLAKACELVEQSWASESATDRAAMVEQFRHGLSPADEPWLESRLDDRSRQVRTAAAELLARIPKSALVQRMTQRLGTHVGYQAATGLLRKKPATLSVTLPEKADEAMARDSLEAKAKGGLGAGAALLSQMVALAPLEHWISQHRDPETWLSAARSSEWALPLVIGWKEAACREQNASWAEALLTTVCLTPPKKNDFVDEHFRLEAIAPLLGCLTPHAAQAFAVRVLQASQRLAQFARSDLVIQALDFPWDEPTSRAIIEHLATRLTKEAAYDYTLRQLLTEVVPYHVSPNVAQELAERFSAQQAEWSAKFAEVVQELVSTVRMRGEMRAALATSP